MLSPQELEQAQTVLRNLQSSKYKNRNDLFLEPFDVNDVPGYLDVCRKVVDLRTVSQNVDRGVYSTLGQVWEDTKLIFENAVLYHSDKIQTKWIAKNAKDMIKAFAKERKALEKGSVASLDAPALSSAPAALATGPEKKKISLKLKLPTKDRQHIAVKAKPTLEKPAPSKLKLKLSLKSKIASNGGGDASDIGSIASSVAVPQSAKSASLKPSLPSAISAAPVAPEGPLSPPVVVPPQSKPPSNSFTKTTASPKLVVSNQSAPSASSSVPNISKKAKIAKKAAAPTVAAGAPSNTSKPKLTLKLPSRGKELPKGVTTAAASSSAPSVAPNSLPINDSTSTASATPANAGTGAASIKPVKTGKVGKGSKAAAKTISKPPATVNAAEDGYGSLGGGKDINKKNSKVGKAKVSKSNKAKAAFVAANSAESSSAVGDDREKPISVKPISISKGKVTPVLVSSTVSPPKKAPTSSGMKSSISSAKKNKKASATAITTAALIPASANGVPSSVLSAQTTKVVLGLRRRQQKNLSWFNNPVSDKNIIAEYRAKIKHPMDISTLATKLDSGAYSSIPSFVLDVRRIVANCLKFNTSLKDSLRTVAVEVLQTAEDLMQVNLASLVPYPKLLYCWKLCVCVLDTLYNLVNPMDGQPTALYFLHPVSVYCGGKFPHDYLEKCPKPMDFGTVTANLLEATYTTVDEFCQDCRLVLSNCLNYYGGREDGKLYIDQANRLQDVLEQQVEQLERYEKSARGIADQAKSNVPVVLPQPPQTLLLSVLEDLRALQYTDKATKITEPAMGPFEKPVSLIAFPDYTQYVSEPMDLQSVERKVRILAYKTPEDFEYDTNLVFKNCEAYNAHRSEHLVAMAKFASRKFRMLFYSKMRSFEDPSSVSQSQSSSSSAVVKPDKSDAASSPPAKKLKIESSGVTKGKSGPRISITAAQVTSASLQVAQNASSQSSTTTAAASTAVPAQTAAARAKSPGAMQKKSGMSATASAVITKPNQPVPLHIAIVRVKEAFPLRRALKCLQPWETDCARYFKELMRHPWISAARPKFIFHVPVPTLFPDLRDAYKIKIKTPMDLTTVECTLLAGNRYAGPEDFISDIALVFTNSVQFNKDGRDIGDPLSCAYYDASIHLLRYSRWLSLELLQQYAQSSDEVDVDGPEGLPPLNWKLTQGNRKRAREEMEKLVLNEPIEKSLEGDRWTWHEAECEKLLKALRHQSDLRYMTFFIQPNYPADYAAFISKPMDWEKVQRTLKKRQYDKFGDVIEDLRLIFSNALKYNARLKGTDTVSGRAYDAANYMSTKLEAAINKLMLSVGDRLERERIDHANAEREIEAAERAEEAQIRAAWKKEPDNRNDAAATNRPDAAQKMRLVRRAAQRRETTDFEIPFFDEEDDGQHERSYFEVVKSQKAMFERQRHELLKMRQCAVAIGSQVHARLLQRSLAVQWVEQELQTIATMACKPLDCTAEKPIKELELKGNVPKASCVLGLLERHIPIQLKFPALKSNAKGSKRKRPALSLE